MEVVTSKEQLRSWLDKHPHAKKVLAPTMGALHRGHTSLFDLAREKAGDDVAMASIFVNPTQFGPNEDFGSYPRQLEADLELCEKHGIDLVFAPPAGEVYAENASISIHEKSLSTGLCGGKRPGHFDGVCTVVAKLFHLFRADAAVFGEKDFQQLAVIRRMVRDLDFEVEIVPGPTVREEDGLAMSSRNAYLSEAEREQAPILFQTLTDVAKGISSGRLSSPEEAVEHLRQKIESAPLARIDYAEIVNSDTLEPLDKFGIGEPRLLVAVFFGKTRLIDNVGLPSS
ncbi:MAG: pantoate--beta-alanine ligase [Verrucomicrobiales bacterium]|nr:pantoate--beta-alanine ligase [Verrucomicrobiales bacterium]